MKTARRGSGALWILLLNIALLVCAVSLYGRYSLVYQERLREENLGNIANLNQSAANNATMLIDSWSTKLDDLIRYGTQNAFDYDRTLQMIEQANSSAHRQFELIGGDYTGHLARRDENGAFIAVDYRDQSYAELQKSFDDVDDQAHGDTCFAPEFSDYCTATKHFAIYAHLSLPNAAGVEGRYTLMLAAPSREVLAAFNSQNVFDGLSTVLIDARGNYIVSSADFKSNNFFQYLYVYNDLSLDQRAALQREMLENERGEFYYRNGMDEACVFRYAKMETNDWYCVTSVPISSFRTPVFSIHYDVYAVLSLVLMLAIDLLWLRSMNRRLRLSMEHEREASNAKTDFLSRMSHDIRTPLNGIIGLTSLALEEENPPKTKNYLDNIKVSGDFLLGLVNDILDMSKVESGKLKLQPEPYSNGELCGYIKAVFQPLCDEKGQELRIMTASPGERMMADRLRVNQIFFNLLSNAVKYTPAGGRIEFFWETDYPREGRVAFAYTVRDNGAGMSETFQKHMFENFSQENPATASTGVGLGLSIVWSLVKLMGGRIDVSSKKGEGSTFTVYLEAEQCRERVEQAKETERTELAGKRVLLCEDNEINVMVAQQLLEKWGVQVDVAQNGRIGAERFEASPPNLYHAVLMDVQMPEMNGLDATRAIRALNRPDAQTVPILAMTANAYDVVVQNCLDAGMTAHMGKPIQPERLRTMLLDLIRRRSL